MDPSLDIESRSRLPTATAVTVVPADVHATIKKIVSLLSRALVLALGLLKAIVVVPEIPRTRRIENQGEDNMMVSEEASVWIDPGSGLISNGSSAIEPTRTPGVNGNRYVDMLIPTHVLVNTRWIEQASARPIASAVEGTSDRRSK